MIGGYIDRWGVRSTFEIGKCTACNKGGKVMGTTEAPSKRAATFMLSKPVRWLYDKTDIEGNTHDRLCGPCIERIELLEVKRAGEKEVSYQ